MADPHGGDAVGVNLGMIQQIVQAIAQVRPEIVVGERHPNVAPVQRFYIPFPSGKQVRSQADVAVGGKLGRQVQGVLHQAVTLVAQDHRPERTGLVLRYGQETLDPVAKIYHRCYRAGVGKVLHGGSVCLGWRGGGNPPNPPLLKGGY